MKAPVSRRRMAIEYSRCARERSADHRCGYLSNQEHRLKSQCEPGEDEEGYRERLTAEEE